MFTVPYLIVLVIILGVLIALRHKRNKLMFAMPSYALVNFPPTPRRNSTWWKRTCKVNHHNRKKVRK